MHIQKRIIDGLEWDSAYYDDGGDDDDDDDDDGAITKESDAKRGT